MKNIMFISLVISISSACASYAGESPKSETKSLDLKSTGPNSSIVGYGTTMTTQPNTTGGNTQQGTDRGSSSNSGVGVGYKYEFR